MSDRIPCINPNCRRTADAAKFPGQEIVCAKCWKLVPKALTARYRQIRQRWRTIERLVEKCRAKGRHFKRNPLFRLAAQERANWAAIRSYFLAPASPEGLENFLKENGLA